MLPKLTFSEGHTHSTYLPHPNRYLVGASDILAALTLCALASRSPRHPRLLSSAALDPNPTRQGLSGYQNPRLAFPRVCNKTQGRICPDVTIIDPLRSSAHRHAPSHQSSPPSTHPPHPLSPALPPLPLHFPSVTSTLTAAIGPSTPSTRQTAESLLTSSGGLAMRRRMGLMVVMMPQMRRRR